MTEQQDDGVVINMNDEKQKVIVVGAGPAGVTCALEIMRRCPEDFDVEILEETHEVGGISRTVSLDSGYRMDIGGHRFFSQDDEIMDWWKEIMPLQGADAKDDMILGRHKDLVEDGPDPETVDEVMLKRQRISRIFYDDTFFDYPVSLNHKTLKAMGFKRTMSVGFSYLGSMVSKKEEDNLENFYVNRFGRKLYNMFFEDYTEKLWGRHPREIAADWGSQRVKGLSVFALLKDMGKKAFGNKDGRVETSLIEEFLYPKLGPGQLWERAVQEFENLGGTVSFGHKVTGIKGIDAPGKKTIEVQQDDGSTKTLECDFVVSTMPLADLSKALGDDLPGDLSLIAEALPYRDFVTVGMLLEARDMRIKNETDTPTLHDIVPDNWIYVQDETVKLGRLQVFNNWSPYLVEDDTKVWLGLEYFCNEGDSFWEMDEKKCVEKAVEDLSTIGVVEGFPIPLLTHREKVKKAYPAYFDSYSQIDDLSSWLKGADRLFCIGRNGQHRYNNMDHSMATAILSADAICGGPATQDDIWNVNTDEGYHEEKSDEKEEL